MAELNSQNEQQKRQEEDLAAKGEATGLDKLTIDIESTRKK